MHLPTLDRWQNFWIHTNIQGLEICKIELVGLQNTGTLQEWHI